MKQYLLNNQAQEAFTEHAMLPASLLCCPDQLHYRVSYDGKALSVQNCQDERRALWHLDRHADELTLKWDDSYAVRPEVTELLAAIEAAFTNYPHQARLYLIAPTEDMAVLFESGVLVKAEDGRVIVYVELFWQQARLWHTSPRPQSYPIYPVLSQGRRHPLRPPKPQGIVYQRHIAWLGRLLSFRTLHIEADLVRFNRWMNDPVVAEFWQETGDLAKHRAYLEEVQADPHVINLIGYLDDEPFGYFEIYWAKENRIAPYYEVDDFDRGWHVLIGEQHLRGKPYVTAWLPSISHYLFLDDDRTQRIVIEPRADNHKMIRNLARCGYAHLKEFDFPHKRAMLGMLLRERFFAEQLWVPRSMLSPHSVS